MQADVFVLDHHALGLQQRAHVEVLLQIQRRCIQPRAQIAFVDICPMDCITFTDNGEEVDLRTRLKAPATNAEQDLFVSAPLKTQRVLVKDEDVCLHCGLCAERCPTGAWDMQTFLLNTTKAGSACRDVKVKLVADVQVGVPA